MDMIDISRKKYERSGIDTIVDNDGILRLNEKHIEEASNHKKLREIKIKYYSDRYEHRYEQANEPKSNAIEVL